MAWRFANIGEVVQVPVRDNLSALGRLAHAASLGLLAVAALAALVATALSALGVIPWLSLEAGFGAPASQAGMVAQVGVTALLWLLLGTIPSGARVLALERSHRDFRLTMQDVAQAYHVAHAGDRQGAFRLSSEFDAVRERIEYLRAHPDLRLLEADVLTLAAQMSRQSHKLAVTYADERVARAREFLRQRQEEVDAQRARIAEALALAREIGEWTSQVELEEAAVATQVEGLEERLQALLPALGYRLDRTAAPAKAPAAEEAEAKGGPDARRPLNVVPMGSLPAAE